MLESFTDWIFKHIVIEVLLGAGIWLTARTGVVQLRRFAEAWRVAFARSGAGASGVLTPFQAFMTALGASIGTGNIAGVATAIVSGGPGALFWIWVYGFVAMAIKFAEATLGLTFREATGTTVLSGPMYYLRDGLKSPALAWTFAFVAAVAALTTTPFTQPNSIALVVNSVFGIPQAGDRHRDRRPDVARHHRGDQGDRPRRGAPFTAEGRAVSRGRRDRHSAQRAADPRRPRDGGA